MAKKRTLEELIRRLGLFQDDMKRNQSKVLLGSGRNFLEEKKKQILSNGVGKYSKRKYYAGSLKGKELSGAGLSFLESKIKKKEKTNWAGLRQAEGLQTSFVDLYYSGQMWNSLKLVKQSQVSYTIQASNKLAQQKLNMNKKRYGDFLKPTPEQKKNLGVSIKTQYSNLLNKRIR